MIRMSLAKGRCGEETARSVRPRQMGEHWMGMWNEGGGILSPARANGYGREPNAVAMEDDKRPSGRDGEGHVFSVHWEYDDGYMATVVLMLIQRQSPFGRPFALRLTSPSFSLDDQPKAPLSSFHFRYRISPFAHIRVCCKAKKHFIIISESQKHTFPLYENEQAWRWQIKHVYKKKPSFWAIKMREEFWQTDLKRFRIFDLALLYVLNINGRVFGRVEMCFFPVFFVFHFCVCFFYFFCVSHLGNLVAASTERLSVTIAFENEWKLLPQWAKPSPAATRTEMNYIK